MTSTSLSSRGAMNSNEMLGLLRASMSAIRMVSGNSIKTQPFRRRAGALARPPGRVGFADAPMRGNRQVSSHVLPQEAGVSDAARHALRIEIVEQSQHRAPARAHAVAQLGHGDLTAGGDDLFHHRD